MLISPYNTGLCSLPHRGTWRDWCRWWARGHLWPQGGWPGGGGGAAQRHPASLVTAQAGHGPNESKSQARCPTHGWQQTAHCGAWPLQSLTGQTEAGGWWTQGQPGLLRCLSQTNWDVGSIEGWIGRGERLFPMLTCHGTLNRKPFAFRIQFLSLKSQKDCPFVCLGWEGCLTETFCAW